MRQCREYCNALLPVLRLVAESCGYAIAVHGSLERDIDLIAVPWRNMEMPTDYLVEQLFTVVKSVFGSVTLDAAVDKPHGRKAYSIRFCGHHYIDLSVIPPIKTTEQQQ
jgi:hypothetical protein